MAKLSALTRRLISGATLIIIAALTLFVNWFFCLVATALIAIGLSEFFAMVEKKGVSIYKYFGVAVGVLIPLSIYFRFELTKSWELFFFLFALLSLIVLQFKRRDNSQALMGISVTLFGILYVAWFFSFIIKLKLLPGGMNYVASVILITKGGDIGAYFIGSARGKTPLLERISPKKSVEGAIGGLFCSMLMGGVCRVFLPFAWWHLLIMGAVFGVIGQLGDLSESLFKRDCQVKDSSSIIPGMGGVLDVLDSLLFTVPVFYFYISVISFY